MSAHAIFSSTGSYFLFFVSISALVFFISGISAEEPTTSKTPISTQQNSTDSTAQESTVKPRKVRNNVIRYGAIYRGNSSVRATRAFTRRPRLSRKDKHRHSTKVDTTKIPVVLLPPVLTFKNLENEEKNEPFLINVVSPKQPTVLPDLSTKPFTPAYDNQATSQSTSTQYSSKKPFMDEKIMAMKNFGVRMKGRSRGEVKFQGSSVDQSSTPVLTDYTPPPTVFPTVQKSRQFSRSSRRRSKLRATTALPTTAETTTLQILPRENQYDVSSPSQSQQTSENSGIERNQAKLNVDNLIYQDSSTPSPINDFTNASLNDVLNYDIQRTSPRTIFSLDATGPIQNYGSNVGIQDAHVESNNENQVRHDGKFGAVSSPSPVDHRSVTISSPGTPGDVGITVSSPGTPTTHVDDFFSNVPQVSSSFLPRTEINVATSTSQFTDSSTPTPNEDDYDFKDVIYPPLDILAPPYLEDEFHDAQGNILPNVTNHQLNNDDPAHLVEQTTALPDLPKSIFVEFVDNGLSFPPDEFNNSVQNPTESYQDLLVKDQSRSAANHQVDAPVVRQPVSSQYTDCENGDCQKNETVPQPWSRVPVSPSDIKVLSNEDGIELINRMYENLLRVLNGGPDYYDLTEDPQPSQQFPPQDQYQQQLEQQQQFQQQQLEQQEQFQQQQQQERHKFQQQQQQQFQGLQNQQQPDKKQNTPHDSSSESSLVLAESGDIRNSRGRAQNELVSTGRRSSRRKGE